MIVLEPLIPVDLEILTGSSSTVSSEKALMLLYVVTALPFRQPSPLPYQHGLPFRPLWAILPSLRSFTADTG